MSATKGTVNLSPIQIRSILSTTSKLTNQAVGDGSIRTAAQQGSGIVQLDKAVQSLTQILPDRFNLNDTAHFANTQSVQLINRNRAAVTYAFSNAPANSVLTYQNVRFSSVGYDSRLTDERFRASRTFCRILTRSSLSLVRMSLSAPTA